MLARRGPKKWVEVRNYCEPLGLGSTFDQVVHLIFQRVPISLLYAGKVLGAPLWGSLVSCGRLAIGQFDFGHTGMQLANPVGQTSEELAKFGSMTAPSRSRLGKWIPFNVEFPSPAQRAPRKQAVSSNSASSSSVCGGLQPASARPEISQSSQTGGVSSA